MQSSTPFYRQDFVNKGNSTPTVFITSLIPEGEFQGRSKGRRLKNLIPVYFITQQNLDRPSNIIVLIGILPTLQVYPSSTDQPILPRQNIQLQRVDDLKKDRKDLRKSTILRQKILNSFGILKI